jgi:hypothetical protein
MPRIRDLATRGLGEPLARVHRGFCEIEVAAAGSAPDLDDQLGTGSSSAHGASAVTKGAIARG